MRTQEPKVARSVARGRVAFAMRAALLAALLCFGGCERTRFVSPYPDSTAPPAVTTVDELRTLLAERASAHPMLWAKGDLTIRTQGRSGSDLVTATVLYRQPGDYRLRASRVPIGNLFEVILKPDVAMLHFNRESRLFTGSPAELREKLDAVGNLTPEDFLNAVLVQQRLRAALEEGSRVLLAEQPEAVLIVRRTQDGRQEFWRLRKADGLIDQWLLRSPSGETLLDVRYAEYELLDVRGRREPLPWELTIRVPVAKSTLRIELEEYKIDPPLRDAAFAAPNAAETYPLRALVFEEPAAEE